MFHLPVGTIEEGEIYEEKEFVWKITNISSFFHRETEFYISPVFSYANNSWFFSLYPEDRFSYRFISLYLHHTKRSAFVVHDCGVKKLDGSIEHFVSRTVESADTKGRNMLCLIKVSELEQRKAELAPSDVLTLTCTLKRGTSCSERSVLGRPIFKNPTNLIKLSQNFEDIFADKESSDITLRVMNKEFKAHRSVLMARSSVFYAMFRHDMSERETGIVTIPDCDPDSFQEFLKYLYCGQLEDTTFSCVLHLYSMSCKYDVQDLKELCAEYFMQYLTVENVCEVFSMADKYDDKKLLCTAQMFFSKNHLTVFHTTGWDILFEENPPLAQKLLKGCDSRCYKRKKLF